LDHINENLNDLINEDELFWITEEESKLIERSNIFPIEELLAGAIAGAVAGFIKARNLPEFKALKLAKQKLEEFRVKDNRNKNTTQYWE